VTNQESSQPFFASRLGLILSVLGIAVGTGNIWRFPRIVAQNAGENGGGAFLIAWIIFLFAWSIPLIIAEYALGRKTRIGLVGTFAKVAGRKFAWMGTFVAMVATSILFYYAVVAGWCMFYASRVALQPLPTNTTEAQGVWESFQSGGLPAVFHIVAITLGGLAVLRGVGSIERVNKVLIPSLLVVVLICLVRALTLDGSGEGIRFLFTPEWKLLLEPRLWLDALTQNAWDTGAGWGLILSYAIYMQHRHGVVKNAFITAVGNNTVSLLAAITIFAAVFALLGAEKSQAEIVEVMKTSGPASTGLTFLWIPQLLQKIEFGRGLTFLFFVGLSFAAFSSLISMIELATRVLLDAGLPRRRAVGTVCALGILFGLPSAIWLGVFENQDFVWGVALMLAGAFVAFCVVRYGARKMRTELIEDTVDDWRPSRAWQWIIAWLVPVQAVLLLVWWLAGSAKKDWYNPFAKFSLMTCLVQWAIALAIAIAINRKLVARTLGDRD